MFPQTTVKRAALWMCPEWQAVKVVSEEISELEQFDKMTLQNMHPLQITLCLNTEMNNNTFREHVGIMLYIFYSLWIKVYLLYSFCGVNSNLLSSQRNAPIKTKSATQQLLLQKMLLLLQLFKKQL